MDTITINETEEHSRSSVKRLGFMALTLALFVTAVSAFAGSNEDRGGALGALDAVAEQTGFAAESAEASGVGCTTASYGSVCISVDGDSTTVDRISVWRHKTWQICRYSAWIYAVYPSGNVSTVSYQSRNNCTYSTGWFTKTYSHYRYGGRYFPHGTRICVEWKEFGSPVGGEPCLTIRR